MKNGTCPRCDASNVYFKTYALDKVSLGDFDILFP
jgi:hypothetical protein